MEWIDINKEQPKNGQTVLVWGKYYCELDRHCNDDRTLGVAIYDTNGQSLFECKEGCYYTASYEHVTYWLPIIEPKGSEVK